MTKYGDMIADDQWENDDPEGPPAWKEDTSATSIEIDVQLHEQGYQNDEKWTVHCTGRHDGGGVIAGFAVKHQNKGNFWRHGELWDDAIDFADLPLRVRQRVAHVLNRELAEITPESREIHREDGRGIADSDDRHCDECGDRLATDADHGWVCLTCKEPREGPTRD